MNITGFKDKKGTDILLGTKVILEGEEYEVIVNDFNQQIVVDNDLGQAYLSAVHMNCEVVSS